VRVVAGLVLQTDEARSSQLHESQQHPDEGILAHVQELVPLLEKAGIVVEVDDEEGDADVDMA